MRVIGKNRKKRDCGVIAAFNAAVWCNSPKSYSKIEKLAKSCGYNPKNGIYAFQFSHLMKKLTIPAKRIKPKSMDSLTEKVYLGRCLIVLYTQTGANVGHAITVFMDHKGNIRIFNPIGELRNWSQLAMDIKKYGMKDFNVYEIGKRIKRYDVARSA